MERLLDGRAGIKRALIYGSWARRYAGEVGPEPADIDLLVIGVPDVQEVRRRAEDASKELGRDVNVTVLTYEEWDDAASGFVRQLRSSPFVELDLQTDAQRR